MLRDYQQRAINDLYTWFSNNETGNPCLVLPTGSGKSVIIAALVKDALTSWPETRILMLTHQKELIAQNAERLRQYWPRAPLGIYSASLKRRVLDEPITFAGIQSVVKKSQYIGHIDLVFVDECHAINHAQSGSYRKLLAELLAINPSLRVIGLSATPYRLGHGYIHEGEDVLFTSLLEPIGVKELVTNGYLSPLRSKHTEHLLSTEGVKRQGGEFVAAALEQAVDTFDNNRIAIEETMRLAVDRKSWLFFCAGINHAQHVADLLTDYGISAACLTGETSQARRDEILRDFKSGKIKALTNVNVLTTGFDYPGIDCVVMLRPTLSPGLYVQMAGRGMRIAAGKQDCLVLDFAGNVSRHGPITAVQPPNKARKGEGNKAAPTKQCEACQEIVAANCKTCTCCGFEFPAPEKVETPIVLYDDDIMGLKPTEMLVTSWHWVKHISRTSGKEMLKASYYGGLNEPSVTEYFAIMHEGYAGDKSKRLLKIICDKANANIEINDQLDAMVENLNQATMPKIISYLREGKFFKVVDRLWD